MKKTGLTLCSFLAAISSFACTTFCINKDGHIVFGRNYDWMTGAGIVYTNQKGLYKISSETDNGKTIDWVSKYGSITFNQYGKEFPTGGMNEKGLVVELMWLNETKYPDADGRASLNVLQWVQYQLDNASTVEEVIASDKKIRIAVKETPLHYLVADAAGNVASIEFLGGKMIVHTGNELQYPVLTNSTYKESSASAATQLKQKSISQTGNNSLDRFVESCKMIEQLDAKNTNLPLTDYAFSILDKVSQGDFTKWSIVYDITGRRIYFKTERYQQIKFFEMKQFDFSCSNESKMFNMNQQGKGDIAAKFILPDKGLKNKIFEGAMDESSSQVSFSAEERKEILTYDETIHCK